MSSAVTLSPLTLTVVPAKAGTHNPTDKTFYVYMLSSARYGTLYTGVTSDMIRRVWEHREGVVTGFTRTYGVKHLVWFEAHDGAVSAITREKQIKKWNREWKINLIQKENPHWRDLYDMFSA